MNSTRNFAFIPIDIPFLLPIREEYRLLNELIRQQKITRYNFAWNWINARLRKDAPDLSFSFFKFFPDLEWGWDPRFQELCPSFCQNVDNFLPFKKLTFCSILQQYRDIGPHQDLRVQFGNQLHTQNHIKSIQNYEPAAYRALLTGRHYESLFVSRHEESEKKFCRFPEGISYFVLSESIYYHGATLPQKTINGIPSHDKIVAFFGGLIDHKKHHELILKSIKKYQNYCIKFE